MDFKNEHYCIVCGQKIKRNGTSHKQFRKNKYCSQKCHYIARGKLCEKPFCVLCGRIRPVNEEHKCAECAEAEKHGLTEVPAPGKNTCTKCGEKIRFQDRLHTGLCAKCWREQAAEAVAEYFQNRRSE